MERRDEQTSGRRKWETSSYNLCNSRHSHHDAHKTYSNCRNYPPSSATPKNPQKRLSRERERERERLQCALARRPRSPAKEATGDFVAWSRRVVPHCVVFVLLQEHLFYFILFYKKIQCFAIPMEFKL